MATRKDDLKVLERALAEIELRVRYAKNDALDMEWETIAIRLDAITRFAALAATSARRLHATAID